MGGHGEGDDDYPEDGTLVDFDPANRRAEPRVEAELRVDYSSFDEFVVAYTEDISRGGLFLVTETLQPIGSIVRLNLALPNDGPTLRIIARVAYVLEADVARGQSRRGGMGMEFLDVEGGPLADQLDAYLTLNVGDEVRPRSRLAADVLLVDPDEVHRAPCDHALRRAGHRVSIATSGMEALGLILRVPPDVIVADTDLPAMDGWRLLRLIRERPSIAHIPFILMVRSGEEAIRLRAFQGGVDDLIVKPVTAADVVARVDRVMVRAQEPRRQASRNALRGDLGQVALGSLLSFIELEKRTGQMLVVRGDAIATLHIRAGDVIHVDLPGEEGLAPIDRLYRVLDWADGQFELGAMEVTAAQTIELPTSHALMEHARRTDEARRRG